MKKGEQSLRLELLRRRAVSDAVRDDDRAAARADVGTGAADCRRRWRWWCCGCCVRARRSTTPREQLVTLAGGDRGDDQGTAQGRAEDGAQGRERATQARRQGAAAARDGARPGAGARQRRPQPCDVVLGPHRHRRARGERVGAARERLEAAIERANVPERVDAVRERVGGRSTSRTCRSASKRRARASSARSTRRSTRRAGRRASARRACSAAGTSRRPSSTAAKFFWARSRHHVIDNPLSVAKVDRLIEALELAPGARVLDIATGKGETLCRVAARYGAQCTGVERSPYFCDEARRRRRSAAWQTA